MDPVHHEKEKVPFDDTTYDSNGSKDADFETEAAPPSSGGLSRELKGRHMQMIAIGKYMLYLRLWELSRLETG